MKITDTILSDFEVTVISDMSYVIKKVVSAKNEYEAVLEMAGYLSGDFDFYHNDGDYDVLDVISVD